jgi:hypothetical protein
MGIGAGGMITQKIYPDTYGFDTWERDGTSPAQIYIINSEQFSSITGEAPPPSTISAADYTKSGFPWFELWDAERGDLGSQSVLENVKSIGTVAASRDLSRQEPAIHIPKNQIKKIRRSKAPRSRTR